ncbi:MAG: GTP 3',8-cyclase MoaA, partial [Lentisphaeraceae bacterium]|nr:GTP 3',8-cyclase MoaA [Lentisphaeraceae bacterium]
RCHYCMPDNYDYRFLREKERMSHAEILRFVRLFKTLGMQRIRLTGGEPLLRPDLHEIVKDISESVELNDLALTTNGQLLGKHAQQLKDAGLKRVTVSLDSLEVSSFKKMSGGRGSLTGVLAGIDAALEAGLTPLKVNTVMQKGMNDDQILPLARFARDKGLTVRFIEYMDVGNRNKSDLKNVVPSRDVLKILQEEFELEAKDEKFYGEVAQHYKFSEGEGGIGLISSVTQPFCGTCTRGRLSAEGKFYTCLFASEGTDLLGPMRRGYSDDDLQELISDVWNKRTDRYSEERGSESSKRNKKIEMFHIGG